MRETRAPRVPEPHDFDRLINAGRTLVELDLHRKPMRAELYRTTAVAVGMLLQRVKDTRALRNVVATVEPTQTLFENAAFDRDGDFRAFAGEAAAKKAADISRALLRRLAVRA